MSCEVCGTHQTREKLSKALAELGLPYYYCPNCGRHIGISIFLDNISKECIEDENGKALLLNRDNKPVKVDTFHIDLDKVDISHEMELLKKHCKIGVD